MLATSENKNWESVRDAKLAAKKSAIPPELIISSKSSSALAVIDFPEKSGLLSAQELLITSTDVPDLLRKLSSGEWSSLAVVQAFAKRALIADQLTNCLTEIFLDKAYARAKELDDHLAKTGKPVGPLHGLPVSLKDQLCVQGVDTTMGYAGWAGQIAEEDSVVVKILKNAGAVPYVRTNIPQSLMVGETTNPVFGLTTNPYNTSLTCGGSSGGEGALVALRGSPIGVGSDIGGSIRIPSSFNGLYGFKPSNNRVPYKGAKNSLTGQEAILSVLGPLTHSVESCTIFMKAVVDSQPWLLDHACPPIPWRAVTLPSKLKFGYYVDNGHVRPVAPVERAMKETLDALEKAGHEVVAIDVSKLRIQEAGEVAFGLWTADGGEDISRDVSLGGEPFLPVIKGMIDGSKSLSTYQFWQLAKKKDALRDTWLDEWNKHEFDAIITPQAPYPAPPHNKNIYYNYTIIFNVLDLPTGIIPATLVRPSDTVDPTYEPRNEIEAAIKEFYSPEAFFNAPVGIQVTGRRWDEEKTLAIMDVVDQARKAAGVTFA
ncbi:hypothetical protein HDU93_005709 [Gonapodya sp. JEL0774]|nr:hypothetical protein HDU93_005709 [Gonapodya sp. JEL0774]